MKIGFDHELYLKKQTEEITKRINGDHKLYLEVGGKLFDDYHASRVLPGYQSNIKIELLKQLKDQSEIIFCINANSIAKEKIRADFGITYDMDMLRLIDELRSSGVTINSVVITLYEGQVAADIFRKKLERQKIKTYIHTYTKGYPTDVDIIVSDEGYGANSYIETTKPIVIVTAPGPGSGKLATCLSQIYHEYKRGIKASYSKYETFPIWDLPLKHPVNIAYEAATADLKDLNMIDSFHLEAYGITATNYNRDMEVFPVLKRILEKVMGECKYKSPTDMGVNTIGSCIINDNVIVKASREEIIRRYYKSLVEYKQGTVDEEVPRRIKMLMNELNIDINERDIITTALNKFKEKNTPSIALKLPSGKIVTGRNTDVMTASAAVVLNSIKELAKIDDDVHLLAPVVLEPMINLKSTLYNQGNDLLTLRDVLLGLGISAATNPIIEKALSKLSDLKNSDAHSSHMIRQSDENTLRTLGITFTSEPRFFTSNVYDN